jgi:hypothetical protein
MVSNLPFLKNKLITMAKPTGGSVKSHTAKQNKKRPGVHSKKKASKSKRAKNYKKMYKGQGK